MNSTYRKWLLVSDIDGTLNDKNRKLPEVNKKSVKSFVSKGGNFTLCSGRNLESLSIHYKKLGIETPAICLNGAGIYDFSTRKVLYYNPISHEGEKILLDIYKRYKSVQLTVFGMDTVYLYTRKCLYGFTLSVLDNLNYKLCKKEKDLPFGEWGKVTLFSLPKVLKEIEKYLKNDYNSKILNCFFTSPFSLEIVNYGVNKGSAVKILAEKLSIDPQNVGAIGDYYNDEAMLKSVAHPVCCGQAPDDLKKLCEYVTCHCNGGAVNDFINYMEKNYINGGSNYGKTFQE